MTKFQFSLIVTFSITFALGYLVGHTSDPAAWTLPILVIAGSSLYASRSLFDQTRKTLKKLRLWMKHSDLGQSSPKLLHPSNWRKP